MWIATRTAALLVLLAVACGGDDSTQSKATGDTQGPPAAQVLAGAADAVKQLRSFHFVLTHENGSTPIVLSLNLVRAEGDIVAPDRLRGELKATQGAFGATMKVVAIGKDLWLTDPIVGKWQKLGQNINIHDIFAPDKGVPELLRNARNGQVTGEETIGGVRSRLVHATVDGGALQAIAPIAQQGRDVPVTIWVGKDDALVRRIDIEGPLTDKEKPDIRRRLDLSKFNQQIEITAP